LIYRDTPEVTGPKTVQSRSKWSHDPRIVRLFPVAGRGTAHAWLSGTTNMTTSLVVARRVSRTRNKTRKGRMGVLPRSQQPFANWKAMENHGSQVFPTQERGLPIYQTDLSSLSLVRAVWPPYDLHIFPTTLVKWPVWDAETVQRDGHMNIILHIYGARHQSMRGLSQGRTTQTDTRIKTVS